MMEKMVVCRENHGWSAKYVVELHNRTFMVYCAPSEQMYAWFGNSEGGYYIHEEGEISRENIINTILSELNKTTGYDFSLSC